MADKFVVRQKKPDKKEDKSMVMTLRVKGAIPVTGRVNLTFAHCGLYTFMGISFLRLAVSL
jgi:hypothetical protein